MTPAGRSDHGLLPATAQVPQADWVIMASIRDSENWFFDYQDATDEGGAWGDEIANWMRKAGYRNVIEEWNRSSTKDENNLRQADSLHHQRHNVLLLILRPWGLLLGQRDPDPRSKHWVALDSRVHITQAANQNKTVSMTVFTWGTRRLVPQPGPAPLSLSDFLDHYYGFVACKF